MPRVVVISAYYNRAHVVDRTVYSIINQTYQDYAAYFIDDNSKDATYSELSKFSSPKINVSTQANIGFTQTVINTINSTDSEFIAIQGSGDVSYPARLERQIACLEANPNAVLVGCYRDQVSEVTGEETELRPAIETDTKQQLFRENPFAQGEVVMRRSAYLKAGGYRPFFIYRQDLDLWLRLSDHGRFMIVPEKLYRIYKLPHSVSEDVKKLSVAMACRDFAIYCARERLAGRADPLDRDGPIAALARPRSSALADDLAFASWRRALRGDRSEAEFLLAAALREKPTAAAIKTSILIKTPGLQTLRRTVRSAKGGMRLLQRHWQLGRRRTEIGS